MKTAKGKNIEFVLKNAYVITDDITKNEQDTVKIKSFKPSTVVKKEENKKTPLRKKARTSSNEKKTTDNKSDDAINDIFSDLKKE
jgi:hypothetical protein